MTIKPDPFKLNLTAPNYWNIVIHSVVSFLGQSLMQVVDLLFCRDLGAQASATIGTATALLGWFIILGLGLTSSLEFLIPKAIGSGNEKQASEYYYAGSLVALVVSAFSTIGLITISQMASVYGMNPAIIPTVQKFCLIVSFSYFPIFLIPLFRVELQSRGNPHDTSIAFLWGNLFNIFLNWAFVLGHAGFPRMGIIGSAYANVVARFGIFAFLLWQVKRARKQKAVLLKPDEIEWKKRSLEIFKMGLPSCLHLLFEIGAFVLVGMLASRLTSADNAAHAIALSLASFAFMAPAGLGSAAALTMSRAIGEQNPKLAKALGYKTIRVGLVYAVIGSLIFWLARYPLVLAYTSDEATIKIGTTLLIIASIFQFGDAMQVILAGCLRGFGITKIQAQMNAIGHWAIGLPLGVLLGFHYGLGIRGLWIGLCVGLFTVALLLFIKFEKMERA